MSSIITPGTILKTRYKIEQAIYESPFVNIYYAQDIHMKGRVWAIREMKIIASDQNEKMQQIARFKREAAQLATISHPLLAKVVDFFSDADYIYLVREFVSGVDLESKMNNQRAPFKEEEVLSWSIQIADLFAYLISKKLPPIFFKEFNMGNIILLSNSNIKLMDMGLAKMFYSNTNLEILGQLGAGDYAAPEQYGENSFFDMRSLIYSLGAFMYHALTNVNPSHMKLSRNISELNPNVSRHTQDLVRRMLDPDPSRRPASFQDLRKSAVGKLGRSPGATIPKSYSEKSGGSGIQNFLLMVTVSIFLAFLGFIVYYFFLK